MRRLNASQNMRPTPYALFAAAVASVAGFALGWFLLAPAEMPDPAVAVVHQRRSAAQASTADVGSYQRRYDAAHADVSAAAEAVDQARQRLDSAVVAATDAASAVMEVKPRPRTDGTDQAAAASPEDVVLLRQQLIDIEAQQQTLAERLTPEHPQMKALDEKLDTLRSALANRSAPHIEHLPDVGNDAVDQDAEVPTLAPEKPELADTRQHAQALLAAQQRYAASVQRERACWQELTNAPRRLVAEVEPATSAVLEQKRSLSGYRWLISLMAATLLGGLVTAIWPVPRHTFSSAEEVRAFTRLPVVVIERAALN